MKRYLIYGISITAASIGGGVIAGFVLTKAAHKKKLAAEIEAIKAAATKAYRDYSDVSDEDLVRIIEKLGTDDIKDSVPDISSKPRIVGFDEIDPTSDFDQITYYVGDGIVADGDGNRIESVFLDVIIGGTDIFEHFGERSNHPDIVFVHNPSLDKTYEVLRMEGTYIDPKSIERFGAQMRMHSENL